MRPIERYLNEIKKRKGIETDSELAARLGIKQPSLCLIRKGTNTPSDELCKRMAALAGDPVEKALILAAESRAPESTRNAWERIFKAAVQAGVVTSFALLTLASPAPSEAAVQGSFLHKGPQNIHYATSERRANDLLPMRRLKTMHEKNALINHNISFFYSDSSRDTILLKRLTSPDTVSSW